MDKKTKQKLLKQFRNREVGDVAKNDDDLEKSLKYQPKPERDKTVYKDFYDDVKLSVDEDW